MITLVRIMGEQWHAVERDLLSLGYRREDIGTSKLTLWELISIVVAAPPGTAVYHAETRQGVLTPEAQLMAASAGVQTSNRVPPQHQSRPAPQQSNSLNSLPDYMGMKLTALPVNELRAKLAELRSKAKKAGDTVKRDQYDPFAEAKRQKSLRLSGVA